MGGIGQVGRGVWRVLVVGRGGLRDVTYCGGECSDIGEEGGDADTCCNHDNGVVLCESLEWGAIGTVDVEFAWGGGGR